MTTLSIVFYLGYLFMLLITAFIAMMVRKTTPGSFQPMLLFWVAIFVFEVVRFFFSTDSIGKILYSLQLLSEVLIICWQAKRWDVFAKRPVYYPVLIISLLAVWITGWLVSDWHNDIPVASLYYSIIIIFLTIEFYKKQMNDYGPPLRNPVILFSLALFLFYFFTAMLDLFMVLGQLASEEVKHFVYFFYLVLGILTSIIYIRSILCIPKHSTYSIA